MENNKHSKKGQTVHRSEVKDKKISTSKKIFNLKKTNIGTVSQEKGRKSAIKQQIYFFFVCRRQNLFFVADGKTSRNMFTHFHGFVLFLT